MGTLQLGIALEGADADIQELEAFLKATGKMDFPTLMALLDRLTKVTIVKLIVQQVPATGTYTYVTTDIKTEPIYTKP